MTKRQKTIILTAAGLIILSLLYPPYYRIGHVIATGKEVTVMVDGGWEPIFDLSIIENKGGSGGYMSIRTKVRFDILSLEILGILVLSGAASIISKKSRE
jgi:hypothetical protein